MGKIRKKAGGGIDPKFLAIRFTHRVRLTPPESQFAKVQLLSKRRRSEPG
jgi:hypothetical protein